MYRDEPVGVRRAVSSQAGGGVGRFLQPKRARASSRLDLEVADACPPARVVLQLVDDDRWRRPTTLAPTAARWVFPVDRSARVAAFAFAPMARAACVPALAALWASDCDDFAFGGDGHAALPPHSGQVGSVPAGLVTHACSVAWRAAAGTDNIPSVKVEAALSPARAIRSDTGRGPRTRPRPRPLGIIRRPLRRTR